MAWLVDCVHSIRTAAVRNLPKLAAIFGDDWAEAHLLPRIIELYSDQTNYMHRLTAFLAINELANEGFRFEIIAEQLLPLVLRAAEQDRVPNIKFNAAKTLGVLLSGVKSRGLDDAHTKIRAALEALAAHPDADVKYYAGEALKLC